jgi:hypothetical protein
MFWVASHSATSGVLFDLQDEDAMRIMRTVAFAILTLSSVLTDAFGQESKVGAPCKDSTKLDFESLTISNGIHHNIRQLTFKNGVALTHDGTETQKSHPAWKSEFRRDTVVRPESGTVIRFLLIYDSPLTGSGWNYWLVGYKCTDGHLQQVFSRDGLSLKIERLDDSEIVVSKSLTYRSLVRTYWSYVWDKNRSTYILSSGWSGTNPKMGKALGH